MASYGPPDDPSKQPTRMADYGAAGQPPYGAEETDQPSEPDQPPAPWYRKRSLLVAWALLVAILVTLIIYGLVHLSAGGGGGPSTTTSTTPSSTTTPSTTTTTATTTTATTPPSSSSEEAPPPPPENTNAPVEPAPGRPVPPHQPPHIPRLPELPPTISIPHGPVITLPPHI